MINAKTKGALAVAATLAMFSGQAAAEFGDFTIDEGSVAGSEGSEKTGDKLNGGYNEVLTIATTDGTDFTFGSQAIATFGQLFANEGADEVAIRASCDFTQCYNLYAVFSAGGSVAGGVFTGTTGSFELFIDPDQDTDFSAALSDGFTAPVLGGTTADDYKIAGATTPTSIIGIAGNPGSFDFVWSDFTLTTAGESYFVAPDPFYLTITVDGDFDEFPIAPGTIPLTGDVSAVFSVPAPGALALFGLGLSALGFRMRKTAA